VGENKSVSKLPMSTKLDNCTTRSFLHAVSHDIYIVSTMHCLSIVYPNPNLPNP